ncbi:MAG: TldD/PmbA family protein [Thermaerobacter sp.]|nr:TldD/PmbA family protein [Thermaerobacter sp.]
MTGGQELYEVARAQAIPSRWVSMSQAEGLVIEAMGPTISITQPPPRKGTVVRDARGGEQREWALPGWHEEWAPTGAPIESFDWTGVRPVAGVSLEEKLEAVTRLRDRLTGRDPRIVQVMVRYEEVTEETRIATDAFDRRSRIGRVNFLAHVVVHQDGRSDHDYVSRGEIGGFEVASITDEQCDRLVENALRLLEAVPVDPGVYCVVTHPEVSGVLAHEAFGHGVEMDLFLSDRARARRYIGQRVGSEFATIIDDPTLPGGFGGYPFDDDGALAKPHVILDRGTLVGGLADADVSQAIPADGGNGRRQDYSRKVYPRMSNTYFQPGHRSPEELIAGVEHGIYLRRVESGMEDPRNWGLQITCHVGEQIEGGRLTGKLYRTLGMTGYVPDVLRSIDGAASDFEKSAGHCGKGWKEWTTNGTGGPHLRMTARIG